MNPQAVPASFRDPSGVVFRTDKGLFRQVNTSYAKDYELLMSSGLYAELVEAGMLVSHSESAEPPLYSQACYKVIEPERIPFCSFPYEWCFGQLQDAALLVLEVQRRALNKGMVLKDASAYNVQFLNGRPVLIDTLSFERHCQGEPWQAYRQFCQHFFAPLQLMARVDVRLNKLLVNFIDGIPLDLASRLLPNRSWLSLQCVLHLHLHARSQKKYSDKAMPVKRRKMSKYALPGLVDNLRVAVERLSWNPVGTEWVDYYQDTNYGDEAVEAKKRIVSDFAAQVAPATLWDMGANTGEFCRLAAGPETQVVAFDIDYGAVEKHYRKLCSEGATPVLPLVLDVTNPSPGIGWQNLERESLEARGPVDLVLALALIHHLCISNNTPLVMVAKFFHSLCRNIIIEFVPKQDSQVQRLLRSREDIFPDYHEKAFVQAFSAYFNIVKESPVAGSERKLFLMSAR